MNFLWIFIGVVVVVVAAQKDSSENEGSTQKENSPTETSKTDPEHKVSAKHPEHTHHRSKPEFLVTPDDRLIIPRRQRVYITEGNPNPRQSLYLSNDAGRYHVQLQNFQTERPAGFQTGLGAISAHILTQRTNQEYVPYPPNGDPYNYPAYRGYPHATEPPVVRAYERASNPNYGVQSPADFDQADPRRVLSNNDYQQVFPNQFENFGPGFYNNPNFLNGGEFYPGFRRNSEPIQESRSWYEDQRDELRGSSERL